MPIQRAPASSGGSPAGCYQLERPLQAVIDVCRRSASLADAGRKLFAATRTRRTSQNDSDRLRKYLARFDLDWTAVRQPGASD